MNWDAISFDWNQIRAFLATVEEGSLSAAARALKQTQPTLSRQISALEQSLNIILFERGPRIMKLTQAGMNLLEHVYVMAEAANHISLSASSQSETMEGLVRITASDLIATYILPKIIAKLRQIAPKLRIELISTDDVKNLIKREADIAIRHARPNQGDLIAKLIGNHNASLFASKAYLDLYSMPMTVAALEHHIFVGTSPIEVYLPYLIEQNLPVTKTSFQYTTSNDIGLIEIIRQGLGMAILPDFVVDSFADLTPILTDKLSFQFPIWLVTHRELHTSRRIRLVYDLLAEALEKI